MSSIPGFHAGNVSSPAANNEELSEPSSAARAAAPFRRNLRRVCMHTIMADSREFRTAIDIVYLCQLEF
jgi:hypothetical protein